MEWLKNICLVPIRMGLDKTNIVAMNLITMLFNIYGKKILKTESDKIINYHECINDTDIFYLHPLYFKEIEYNFFSNYLKIKNGIIKGLSLEFPWKSILSNTTKIKINDIFIESNILESNENMTKSLFESHNSYLENDIEKNSEISDVYSGIDNILKNYFLGITVEISSIKLVLIDHFIICLEDCKYYNNCLKIKNLTIFSFPDKEKILLQIEDIQINKNQNKYEFDITIPKIIIFSNFFYHLPIIKIIPDSNKNNSINFNITLNIFELVFNKLILKNFVTEINFESQFEAIIKDLSYISIDDVLLINFTKNKTNNDNLIKIYDNKYKFNTEIKCKISNSKSLKMWIEEIKDVIDNIKNKFISDSSEISVKKYYVDNLKLLLLYNDDIWKIQTKNIIFDELITIQSVNYLHQNIIGVCEKIVVEKDVYKIINISVKSQEFISKSSMITVNILSGNNINVFDLQCDGMIPLGKYILTIVDLLFSNNNVSENKLENKISFHNSKICYDYMEINYTFIINTINISLTNKYAQDISIDLLIDNYLVSKLNATKISFEIIEIKNIKIFLDVNIFDIFINLLGLLMPENNNLDISQNLSEDILDKLQDALENSIISKNINCLENETNKITKAIIENSAKNNINSPIIKILSESLTNLDSLLVHEYFGQNKINNYVTNIKLRIESSHIYLHHKLLNYNTKNISPPFMCFLFKNIIGTYTVNDINDISAQNYKFSSEKIAIVDINSRDPCWKYFLKFNGTHAVMVNASKNNDIIKIDININPFCLNIREETLIKLLAFFSNISVKTVNNTPLFIEKFSINEINAKINYYPIMLEKIDAGTNNLFIKDYNLTIPAYFLKNIDGFDKLGLLIKNNMEKVINPNNVIQFVPNIKLVKPYVMPINNLILMINKYFNSSNNRKKLRKITRNLNHNATTLSNIMLVKLKNIFYGVN
ncbi:hypothetical protein QJ854_gp223 [Moumouvirus goulette]|uniref:Uncharacterized protein n=1 Tax=Moumouvirus goulette TaxID=1247379 RepID=M1PC77_9VIRU|nr:hypothetical protein QJ854_gp223 [Moumouvirus goulette]AGF85559.1 hypothetical protein glt_00754 [Moumouvirus goulette]